MRPLTELFLRTPGQGRDLAEKASASQEIARGDFHPQALR